MGWENVLHCEINPFCQKVLKYHFPNAISYADIKTTDFSVWRNRIDIITGGFPCQPYSIAGEKKGKEDERYLWPEMFRAFKEIRPRWGVGENVPGIIDDEFSITTIKNDFASIGYHLLPVKIPASLMGANHNRERIWFIAHSNSNGMERCRDGSDIKKDRQRRQSSQADLFNQKTFTKGYSAESESELIRADDGVSNWMERVKALGNAVVPQIVYQIFKTIQQYENHVNTTSHI